MSNIEMRKHDFAEVPDRKRESVDKSPKVPVEKLFPVLAEATHRKDGAFAVLDEDDAARLSGLDRLVIADLKKLPVEKRLPEAIKLSLLTEVDGKAWSFFDGRPIVFSKILGQHIPFYRSQSGTTGKTPGEWYVFFGIGDLDGMPWFIKHEEVAKLGLFTDVSSVLNRTFTWDHAVDLKINTSQDLSMHPFSLDPKMRDKFVPPEELNQLLFKRDLSSIPKKESYEHYVSQIVDQTMKKMPKEEYWSIADENLKSVRQAVEAEQNASK